jgi:hypothetical protein
MTITDAARINANGDPVALVILFENLSKDLSSFFFITLDLVLITECKFYNQKVILF